MPLSRRASVGLDWGRYPGARVQTRRENRIRGFTHLLASRQERQGARRACRMTCESAHATSLTVPHARWISEGSSLASDVRRLIGDCRLWLRVDREEEGDEYQT